MNWLRRLMGRSADKRAAQAPDGPLKPARAEPVSDISQLRQSMATAPDAVQRAACESALGRALAAAPQRPETDDPMPVWVAAVCHVSDKTMALAWIEAINDEPALADIAAGSRFGEVRLAAAQHLNDASLLERVANASRDRDKRVFRHCSERLRDKREAASRAQRLTELAHALSELLKDTPLAGSKLLVLQQEWRALCKGQNDEAECAALLQQAQERFSEEMQSLRTVQAQRAEADTLLSEIAGGHLPSMHKLETWALRSGALEDGLDGSPLWLVEHAEGRALRQTLQDIEGALAAQAEDVRRSVACERFIEGLDVDAAIGASAVAAWEALPKPISESAQRDLQARWQALRVQQAADAPVPETPLASERKRTETPAAAPVDVAAVGALLGEIEQHLEQGRLADAERLDKQIDRATRGAVPAGSLGRRWRRARGQIARLRGWARWGTDQVREHLIADAEELLRGEPDVDERARLVPALRREWKRLDTHGAAAKSQWERFDAALAQVYQPVLEQRAEEAVRHEAARAAKEALCSDWEAWLDGVVWEHADYKVIEAQRQDMLTRWRAAATAGFRDDRALRKRFDALLARIDGKLSEVRRMETARREQLIEIVEGLREASDLGHAIGEAKAAQARWRAEAAGVRLSRADEQALWQRFRSACDAVFARREAQQATTAARREEQTLARLDDIREFEASVQGADADVLQQALVHFRDRWGDSRAARAGDGLEDRARDLVQHAEQRLASLRSEEYRLRLELMARKAALAQRVETAAAAALPTEDIVAEARASWEELSTLPHDSEQLLVQRLTTAISATPETLSAGHAARAALLLDLEIALGLPSLPAHADARRERQLMQLQQHFGAVSAAAQQPESLVAQWFATAATPDAEQEVRMVAIVRRLCGEAGAQASSGD
jgi:exonuclease SbcC